MTGEAYPTPSLPTVALLCRCPRCGRGKLFAGVLAVAPRCTVCDLDLQEQDSGDGPAVFVILILGGLVTLFASLVEVKFAPPLWVHLLLWTPLIIGGAVVLLRIMKAALIAIQFRSRTLGGGPEA
ncbi:MAG TPA: DUF983 domain-containing protein [Aliidongia sp.]|nr:DUF983 domain-containing protein [Aliidongia sp.]